MIPTPTDTMIPLGPPKIPCAVMDTTSSESENNACLPTWIAAVFNDSPLQTSFTNCTVEKTPIVIAPTAPILHILAIFSVISSPTLEKTPVNA